jgi:hypothetical protein
MTQTRGTDDNGKKDHCHMVTDANPELVLRGQTNSALWIQLLEEHEHDVDAAHAAWKAGDKAKKASAKVAKKAAAKEAMKPIPGPEPI